MKKFQAYLISGITKENAKEFIQMNYERWKYLNANEASIDKQEEDEITKLANRVFYLAFPDKEGIDFCRLKTRRLSLQPGKVENLNFNNITYRIKTRTLSLSSYKTANSHLEKISYSDVDKEGNQLTMLRFLNEHIELINLHKDEITKLKKEIKSAYEIYINSLHDERTHELIKGFENTLIAESNRQVDDFEEFEEFFLYFNRYASKGITFVFHDFSKGICLSKIKFKENKPCEKTIKAFYLENRNADFRDSLSFHRYILKEKELLEKFEDNSIKNFKGAALSVLDKLVESDFLEDKHEENEPNFNETAKVTALFLYYINKSPKTKAEANEELNLINNRNAIGFQKALKFLGYTQKASTIISRINSVGNSRREDPLSDDNLKRVIELLENYGFKEAKKEAEKALNQ